MPALAVALLAFAVQPAVAAAVPSFSITDVSANEGNSGTTNFTFTVTLADPPPGNFSIMVDYATTDGTATGAGGPSCSVGIDYLRQSGQLTFNRNNLTRTVAVPV